MLCSASHAASCGVVAVAHYAGTAFMAADVYGCHVHGIDLSVNMILIAIERAAAATASGSRRSINGSTTITPRAVVATPEAANGHDSSCNGVANGSEVLPSPTSSSSVQQQAPHDVTFEVADVLTRDFPAGAFDVCISRDSLLHVEDKQALFSRLHHWLQPGGQLLITDYCKCAGELSSGFQSYIQKRRYNLLTLQEYTAHLEAAGFTGVQAEDCTAELLACCEDELQGLQQRKDAFIQAFTCEEYDEVMSRWQEKLGRAKAGEQLWGRITVRKAM
eukprot:GHRR01010796.1.p1 GENE.GHRR01010796.1~~GHRR01010796.1.p1  ORF type:complete len:276 (+),score=102.66 GHRR01010796.1:277-1104(+)